MPTNGPVYETWVRNAPLLRQIQQQATTGKYLIDYTPPPPSTTNQDDQQESETSPIISGVAMVLAACNSNTSNNNTTVKNDQLKQNATRAGVPFYGSYDVTDPAEIAAAGVRVFQDSGRNLIIVDICISHMVHVHVFM